jgi:dipeptidyl-peptidase 4
VLFLRCPGTGTGAQLWMFDVGTATEHLVVDPARLGSPGDPGGPDNLGLSGYATNAAATTAAFPLGGRVYRADLLSGTVTALPAREPATDPRPDPTGQWVGYLTGGTLRVLGPAGDALLAGEPDPAHGGQPHLWWGRAGWWWAPDGRRVLAARTDARPTRREVTLHLLDLDGGWVDVHWDRETYPHLASVSWSDHGSPVVAVLRRSQQHGLVLAVDPRTGETQVHAELADPRWVAPVPGTPRHLSDGRVLVGGELAHDGYDARCLFADGTLLTPPSLYVRRVVGRLPGSTELLVEASATEPSEQHLYRVGTSAATGIDARPVTSTPGWHRADIGGDVLAIGTDSLDHAGTRWTIWRAGQPVGALASAPVADPVAATPPVTTPRPALQRVTDRRLPTGVLYPGGHVSGRRLPVLVDLGADLRQEVRSTRAAWLARQWWADAGYAVVVVDHRGTPGVAPSFEKVVHRRLADLALADLTDALAALVGKHPDLDLDRVAVRGRGTGGWLAVLAALRRPDAFRCATATAPLVDWAGGDRFRAERYLGPAEDGVEVYQRHSLLLAAAEPPGPDPLRPVLLLPDPATEPATRRLAAALAAAGRPHVVRSLPFNHDRARRAELEFLGRHR